MAIDINALRKFQETWSPVMDAIPAVMDMVAKQADMDRSMAQAKKDLEAAQAEVQSTYDNADKQLAKINDELAKLSQKKRDDQARFDSMLADLAAKVDQAEADAKIKVAAAQARVDGANQQAAAAEAAVGLAIVLNLFRHFRTIDVDQADVMKW